MFKFSILYFRILDLDPIEIGVMDVDHNNMDRTRDRDKFKGGPC